MAGISVDRLKMPLESRRRIYWYLSALAAIFVILGSYNDLQMLLALLFIVTLTTVGSAYAFTPYIRIRGRIYAFQPVHINAESKDANAKLQRHELIATPPKMWWIVAGFALAFDAALCSSLLPGRERINFQDDRELILLALAFCLLFSVGLGYGEAKFGYPIAQRQRLQFVIATISSAGLFAMLYLTSYYLTALTRGRSSGS
ncbi:hypothetical protein [Mycolicibacter sinensis]|uniref:hypothetical protein n=1 Tax=Mycolicibacter sinensis (strain JDM601) TaxID=875328 RepID=UPI001041E30A|nr:hypothetical protein [Mycolicibacter sinensis]